MISENQQGMKDSFYGLVNLYLSEVKEEVEKRNLPLGTTLYKSHRATKGMMSTSDFLVISGIITLEDREELHKRLMAVISWIEEKIEKERSEK
jgi:hypothetical protein